MWSICLYKPCLHLKWWFLTIKHEMNYCHCSPNILPRKEVLISKVFKKFTFGHLKATLRKGLALTKLRLLSTKNMSVVPSSRLSISILTHIWILNNIMLLIVQNDKQIWSYIKLSSTAKKSCCGQSSKINFSLLLKCSGYIKSF